jgi:hypothetical protein
MFDAWRRMFSTLSVVKKNSSQRAPTAGRPRYAAAPAGSIRARYPGRHALLARRATSRAKAAAATDDGLTPAPGEEDRARAELSGPDRAWTGPLSGAAAGGDVGYGARPGPARQPELEGGSAMTSVVVRRER